MATAAQPESRRLFKINTHNSADYSMMDQQFPKILYGDWRRILYYKYDEHNNRMSMKKPGKMILSFRKTCFDFVRAAQWLPHHRMAATWIVDGEWHDRERITVLDENKIFRETIVGKGVVHEKMTLRKNSLNQQLLIVQGFNGTYRYDAVFQQLHPPLKTIVEENESDG